MIGRLLKRIGLSVSFVVALSVALAVLSPVIRQLVVLPLTWVAASIGVVLFVRLIFDPKVHRTVFAFSGEIQAIPYRRLPFNPTWGLFGKRVADQRLRAVRGVLFVECILAMPFISVGKDILLLAFVGLILVQMLSIVQLADQEAGAPAASD